MKNPQWAPNPRKAALRISKESVNMLDGIDGKKSLSSKMLQPLCSTVGAGEVDDDKMIK